jgi:exonuclease SbcD
VQAWVAAIPFLRPVDLGVPAGDAGHGAAVRGAIGEAVAAARAQRQPGQALLALAHLHLAGGEVSELSERRLVVGNQEAIAVDAFPADLAYVALGHLHRAQAVTAPHLRYAGSAIPLSFAERHARQQVVKVELEGERLVGWRAIEVPRTVEVLSLPDGEARPLPEVLGLLAALPGRGDGPEALRPYLEVSVRLAQPEPGLRRQLEEALEGKEARLVRIAPPVLDGAGGALADGAAQRSLADWTPEEVFNQRYERAYGGAPPADLAAAFATLLDEVQRGEAT